LVCFQKHWEKIIIYNKQELNKIKIKKRMVNLTFKNFETEIFNSEDKYINNKPTIIDFSATWCGPCKQMLPIVTELSNEYNGIVDIYKVDIEEENELTEKFGIRSVPTFVLIDKNGKHEKFSGSMSKEKMKSYIDNLL